MNLEEILDKIEQSYCPINKACRQEFIESSAIKTFEKGEIVVREGQFSKKAFLIIKGCSRAYYIKDGKDISDWFTFEHQFMASIISFFSNEPSPHYVEFIEDAVAIEFSKDTVNRLSEKYHDFERLIGKVVTETMLGLCERLHIIQFSKAEERYLHLLRIHPDITQRMPLTHIASYLGITLETLSRIRSKTMRI
ncbi:Crp/Fnr family transcriptional regulator [Crocinitomix algicola]|uniref:Crp/Fnr family transcriptional regulator n=1 Tax=Crocinitomix algicola TaxID=1740263 RepID=UPI00082B9EE3|nr:Crp/Fnr family transcriptional regulator [Crocinitomix algicola]